MTNRQILLDSTKLRSWMQCHRKFYYSYVEHLEGSKATAIDLEFGKLVHDCLEFFENQMLAGESKDQALEVALARAHESSIGWESDEAFMEESRKNRTSLLRLLIWYAEQYHIDGLFGPIRPVANEIPFRESLYNLLRASDFAEEFAEFPIYPSIQIGGRLDSIVEGPAKGEYWIRERKTSSQSLGTFYFARYSPDIQISLYTWVARLLFPELNLQGVLLEAFQIGTNFIRMNRKEIHRWPEQSYETARSVVQAAKEISSSGAYGDSPSLNRFLLNEACCMAGGMPCQFRPVCNTHPFLIGEEIANSFRPREPWNPLDGLDQAKIASLTNKPHLHLNLER